MKPFFFSRTKFPGILLGLLVLGLCFACQKDLPETGNAYGPVSLSPSNALKTAEINNFMVITNSETLPAGFETKLSSYGQIVNLIPEIGVVVVKPTISNFETKIMKLMEVKAVVPDLVAKWIEPNEFISESNPPSIGNDEPYFFYQWGMDAINAPEAWNAGYTGAGARVFILDTGIDAENPELASNLNTELSTSFVPGEDYNIADKSVHFHHGTHVAGIIAAAHNGLGVIGVAPNSEIVAVRVISEKTGSGAFSWINAGIVYAANNGADVINMSLGTTLNRNGFYLDENDVLQRIPASYIQSFILADQRAINYAFKKGVVVIASAGNNASNADGNGSTIILPADLSNVIAVSATAPDYWYGDLVKGTPNPDLDIPASYTNFGKSLVAIAAPGGDYDFYNLPFYYLDCVLSTCPGPSYFWAAGTSMASPHVAGVAALIIAANKGKMSPHDVTQQLLKTADKIDGNGASLFYGKGRVNAYRAVTE